MSPPAIRRIHVSSRAADMLEGAAVTIRTGIAACPVGRCLIARTESGICHLSLFDPGGEDDAIAGLRAEWPGATFTRDDRMAENLAARMFDTRPPESGSEAIDLHVRGTPFQLAVWNVLLEIPCGETRTYQEVAAAAGHPSATRAAGTAIGRNEVSILIPCHRVVRADGSTGGYRWGSARKAAILSWEQTGIFNTP